MPATIWRNAEVPAIAELANTKNSAYFRDIN